MKNYTNYIILAIVVLVIIAIVNMKKPASGVTGGESIKVGVSLPLTGEVASLGEGGRAGAELALKEVNENGGVLGKPLELVFEDDKCSKDGVSAVTKLITIDKVSALIGPLCSPAAGPALPVAQSNNVPTVFWASAPGLTKTGDYVFRAFAADDLVGDYAANYISGKLQAKRVAVMYVQNDWGQGLHDVFVSKAIELGFEVVYDIGFAPDTKDVRTELLKVRASKPDVIYMPMFPATTVVALKQMRENGMADIPVVGGDSLDTDEVLKSGFAKGLQIIVGDIGNPDDFKAKIKASSDVDSNLATPIAYDAVKLIASAINTAGTVESAAVRDAIKNISFDSLAYGNFTFTPDRELSVKAFKVKKVLDDNGVVEEVK